MKLYLSVDMEGISGFADMQFVDSSKRHYARGQSLMTAEVNHVIEEALQIGGREVVVNDSHSKMNNILIEELHPEAKLISGDVKPYSMVQGLQEGYDGAFFIGYHARASQRGVMSHTMIFGVRTMFINDHEIGEMGFNAYVAGHYGVPVLLVTGDDETAKEAEALIPYVTTAIVKEQQSRSAALCLSPQKAKELLQQKTKEALHNRAKVKPLTPPDKPLLQIEFTNYGQAEWAALMPGAKIDEGTTTVRYQAKDILEAYQAMLVMTELAMRTDFC
ncbi:M55 family metallopeptidase [Alkalicoccobacillus porphyridii]|uniref:M55 family metallopeptidase n=1 Tax=Alkalicoccobacillus porphyridii TaxID=2597270 RepID=A0A553ZVG9_9BACI|nr:M55 family metallopeptidase [Alkalicoccobacillus porphyridii]TSB45459.1 M55 family metallopeptidase [Alkalicoccobacillus porphyridii]